MSVHGGQSPQHPSSSSSSTTTAATIRASSPLARAGSASPQHRPSSTHSSRPGSPAGADGSKYKIVTSSGSGSGGGGGGSSPQHDPAAGRKRGREEDGNDQQRVKIMELGVGTTCLPKKIPPKKIIADQNCQG